MLENLDITNVLAIDIETVPMVEHYDQLEDHWKKLWDIKSQQKYPNLTPAESWPSAGIYAEFGKIVCISAGAFVRWGKSFQFKVKSYASENEVTILEEFNDMLEKYMKTPANTLASHNGREFDYPYIARRLMINRMDIPMILDIAGRRPWEINLVDTMELWKFGDFKAYTSLSLIAACLGIPSSKDDIDGSQVYSVYYKEKDLERIKTYCQKDVILLGKILLRFKRENDIPEEFIGFLK